MFQIYTQFIIYIQELKPHNIEERFKNGNYKGAKGFDVDPPPSYIDYGNSSQDKGGGGGDDRKERDKRKWNFLSSDETSSVKESEDLDEKKIEIKSVPFLHLVSYDFEHISDYFILN